MTRARTGSHSRTEPGAVHAYEVVDHGVDNAQYFQGCGVAHTQWDDVAVGVGNTPLDAYEDAVEALAQGGWEVDALPERPRGLRRTGDLDLDTDAEMQHFVCVYVRGIPTRRTEAAQQRRAGTVGPGRPGQQFTHGDVEIETTLHPIDLDGGYSVDDDPRREAWEDETLRARDEHRYELVYSTGGHGGPYLSFHQASRAAERLMRGNHNERWIAVVPYSRDARFRREDASAVLVREPGDRLQWEGAAAQAALVNTGVRGLAGVSPRTRLGTRVRFDPNPASHMLYSERYGLPERGEEGTVTYMPGFKPRTYFPGPGGGLLYVEWDQAGVLGVSPHDVEKV